jgi:hypothetical protein
MPTTATPVIIIVIVARPRAGEPAFIAPRRHMTAAIVILAIAAARPAMLLPAAT